MGKKQPTGVIATRRGVKRDYEVLETLEVGMCLLGTEVKSLRDGKMSLGEAYVKIDGDAAWLVGAHIAEYRQASQFNHEPTRSRKLLLKKRELLRLRAKVREKGLTLVPTKAYFSGQWAKLEVALCRGKKHFDKRQKLDKRQIAKGLRDATK